MPPPKWVSWLRSSSDLPYLSPKALHPSRPHMAPFLAVLKPCLGEGEPLLASHDTLLHGLSLHWLRSSGLEGFSLHWGSSPPLVLVSSGLIATRSVPLSVWQGQLPAGCCLCNGLAFVFSKQPAFLEIFVRWRLRQQDLSCRGGGRDLEGERGIFFGRKRKGCFWHVRVSEGWTV